MERIDSLDFLKGLSILLVIYIHVEPFLSTGSFIEAFRYVISNFSRIAVPSFFLVSGFLLSLKLKERGKSYEKDELKKIGKYYLGASLVYLPFVLVYKHLKSTTELISFSRNLAGDLTGMEGLLNIIYIGKGAGDFLWFFTALFFSIALIHFFYRHNKLKEMFIGSAVLHLTAILSNTYQVMSFLPIPIEDALFFGLFFTTTGFYIGKKDIKEYFSSKKYFGLFIIFSILHLIERVIITMFTPALDVYYWEPYFWGPYSLFTAPMTISFFLYILNNPKLGKNSRIEQYGKHSLLGYLLHPAIIGVFVILSIWLEQQGLKIFNTIVWDLVFLPAIVLLTMEISIKIREN